MPGEKQLKRFRSLVHERVGNTNVLWIQFEGGAADPETAKELLRELHTLKGESALMGFGELSRVVHAIEDSVEGAMRAGAAPPAELGDLILRGFDLITELVDREPNVPTPEAATFVDQLRNAIGTPTTPAETSEARPESIASAKREGAAPSQAVRVTTDQLDRMRDIIGELLLTRTRLGSSATEIKRSRDAIDETHSALSGVLAGIEARLRDDVLRMANLVTGLEDLTRDLRMVPIGTLFDRYPRAVRDLSRDLGRKVKLICEGEAVELDRQVLEALDEPLLHLVRNAVDHGIEAPEVRRNAGKPDVGTLRLRARLIGGMLEVELTDDGRGIDVDKVRQRAIDQKLVEPASVRVLSDQQLLQCLFAPGMSTRTKVTEISGRGVGLDVVQETMSLWGGSVSLDTELGRGTSFRLQVPITVTIISVVLFQIGKGRYALPASAVVGIVDADDYPIVDSIDGAAIRYGGDLVPLLPLERVCEEPPQTDDRSAERIVIVHSGERKVAVTDSHGHLQREAVLKKAGAFLTHDQLVTSAVALEDGSVALVLNPDQLWARSRGCQFAEPAAEPSGDRTFTILVAEDSPVVLDLIAEGLRSHGVQVIEASDGAEALTALAARPDIDLLVTDIEMPNLDGLQLIQKMRAESKGRRIPAVVVSSRGSDADKLAAVEVGADAYIVKSSFSREGLWKVVSRYLR